MFTERVSTRKGPYSLADAFFGIKGCRRELEVRLERLIDQRLVPSVEPDSAAALTPTARKSRASRRSSGSASNDLSDPQDSNGDSDADYSNRSILIDEAGRILPRHSDEGRIMATMVEEWALGVAWRMRT